MNKIEKNSIVFWFMLALFIFLFSTIYIYSSVYPNIMEIELEKQELKNKIEKYDELLIKWFDFKEFKILNAEYSSKDDDKILSDLLNSWFYKKIYDDFDMFFYDNSIYEKEILENDEKEIVTISYNEFDWVSDFWKYLDKKYEYLIIQLESNELKNKVEKMSEILPKYSSLISLDNKWELTDLSFINYIERLWRKYNLKIKNAIWIKDVLSVETNIIETNDNIYYIPLDFDITGTKRSIFNFLKYIKNTWDVKFSDNDFSFIGSSLVKSQLSEVKKIEFPEYIDIATKIVRNDSDKTIEWFLLRTEQWQDIIDVKISLMFYVSAISSEKIKEKINSIIWKNIKQNIIGEDWNYEKDPVTGEYKYELLHYNYSNLLRIINVLHSHPTLNKNVYYKNKVDNIHSYLNNKDLKKDFALIQKTMNKAKDLNPIYKKVTKYKEIFLGLDKEIYEIAKALGLEKDIVNDDKVTSKWIYPKNYYFD